MMKMKVTTLLSIAIAFAMLSACTKAPEDKPQMSEKEALLKAFVGKRIENEKSDNQPRK